MGLFKRVSDIIAANLNDMVDRFEQPEKMLGQAIREMESSIAEATGATAKAVASEKLLAKELAEHEQQAVEWRERAERAVDRGDDHLARRALVRKREHDKLAEALRDQLASAQEASRTVRRQLEAMRAKHAEAKRKLASLLVRQKAADARWRMHTMAPRIQLHMAGFGRFDRMQEKIEQAEAEADAWIELETDPATELLSDFESRDEKLRIEAELTALKQRVQEKSAG